MRPGFKPTALRRVWQSITLLNGLLLVTGLVLYLYFRAWLPIEDWAWNLALQSLNAIVYSLLAGLILSRQPRHLVGWLLLLVGFAFALSLLSTGAIALALGRPIRSEPARALIQLVDHLSWALWLLVPISLVVQFFPNGRLPSRRWRPVPALTGAAIIGFELSQTFIPWNAEMQGALGAANSWALPVSTTALDPLFGLSGALFVISLIGTCAMVAARHKSSQGAEREQMKWLIYSVGIILILLIIISSFPDLPLVQQLTGGNSINPTIFFVLPTLLTIGLGVAILRHQLWDIDLVIQRTVVYGLLTILIVGLYVGIVSALGALFQTHTNTVDGLIATAIIAVLFQPLRTTLQRAANRLLFGQRDDPAAVLTQLAQQLETADSPADILPNLVHTIAQTLKIPHVAIWLPNHDMQFEAVAAWGVAPDHVEMLALIYQNETIGHLVVAPRGAHEPFNRQEKQLLNTIAALTANTVRAVHLSDELRRSRQRIVSAREEERRRLRRDLHDGLGPQLASQTLGLDAVEQLMPTNPEKAFKLLASLKAQAQEAITDVRHLVYELRPPTLDDLGLIGALRQSADRYENGELRFIFDVPDPLPDLPAAVETAVYRIAQEAMTNVVRHAGATQAVIQLTFPPQQVTVAICDNGRGLPPDYQSGVGLQSMRERAAELNGRCLVEAGAAGGTKVTAWLPLLGDERAAA